MKILVLLALLSLGSCGRVAFAQEHIEWLPPVTVNQCVFWEDATNPDHIYSRTEISFCAHRNDGKKYFEGFTLRLRGEIVPIWFDSLQLAKEYANGAFPVIVSKPTSTAAPLELRTSYGSCMEMVGCIVWQLILAYTKA